MYVLSALHISAVMALSPEPRFSVLGFLFSITALSLITMELLTDHNQWLKLFNYNARYFMV